MSGYFYDINFPYLIKIILRENAKYLRNLYGNNSTVILHRYPTIAFLYLCRVVIRIYLFVVYMKIKIK